MIEYKIVQRKNPIEIELLHELGQDGWKLISVVTSDYWAAGVFIYYLSRNPTKVTQVPDYHGEGTA